MNSVQQILAEMAKTNPVINQALSYSQKSDFTKFDEIPTLLAKSPNPIEILPYSLTVYWPDRAGVVYENLMNEMTHLFKGASRRNGLIGTWENCHKEIIPDEITLITSFTNAQGISQNFETFISRVIFWGGICEEAVMAIEIGTMMGSVMLLISIVSQSGVKTPA
jgi:hypothetical protein